MSCPQRLFLVISRHIKVCSNIWQAKKMLGNESEQRQEAADDFKAALNVIREQKNVRRQSQFRPVF